eukprot:2570089-Amphidinium_carterae.6
MEHQTSHKAMLRMPIPTRVKRTSHKAGNRLRLQSRKQTRLKAPTRARRAIPRGRTSLRVANSRLHRILVKEKGWRL